MRKKSLYLDIAFFKMSLIVHFGTTASYLRELERTNIAEDDFESIKKGLETPCNGMVSICAGGKLAMFLNFPARKNFDTRELGILVHECQHVAWRLLEHNHIPITNNDELLSMTLQMVLESVLEEIKA